MTPDAEPGVFSTEVRVRFSELDPYSHVNHSVYVQYFEVGRVSALAQVGHGLDRMHSADVAVVVAQISTRYLAPAFLDDALVIESGVSDLGRVTGTWLQRVVRDGEVLCTQATRVGCTTMAGAPRRLPDDVREALQGFMVAPDWLGAQAPKGV